MEIPMPTDWADANPFFLFLLAHDSEPRQQLIIDLGESGWATKYVDWMRRPGRWWLVTKKGGQSILTQIIAPGEQGYYAAKHVGIMSSGGSNEIIAYGIGKKRVDGHTDRLWALPNGQICGGDDVNDIGIEMVQLMGPRLDHDEDGRIVVG